MSSKITYIISMALILLSCSKHTSEDENIPYIDFVMEQAETKSIIDGTNLNTSGSKIILYDVHSMTSPSEEDQSEAGLVQYLEGEVLTCDGSGWNFNRRIPWTKRGTHQFIAHFSKNANDGGSTVPEGIPVGYLSTVDGESAQTLNVASEAKKWHLTKENQFDFMYANAYRDLIQKDYSPVPLPFKHLFAAVRFRVVNTGIESRNFEGFHLTGMSDSGCAVIEYNKNPNYSVSVTSGNQMEYDGAAVPLASGGGSVFVHAGQGKISENGYFLMWPQNASQYSNIKLNLQMSDKSLENTLLTSISSVNNWQAGYKYTYNINVGDDFIIFELVDVVDWIEDDLILEER